MGCERIMTGCQSTLALDSLEEWAPAAISRKTADDCVWFCAPIPTAWTPETALKYRANRENKFFYLLRVSELTTLRPRELGQ
jgi:hypothetical protein